MCSVSCTCGGARACIVAHAALRQLSTTGMPPHGHTTFQQCVCWHVHASIADVQQEAMCPCWPSIILCTHAAIGRLSASFLELLLALSLRNGVHALLRALMQDVNALSALQFSVAQGGVGAYERADYASVRVSSCHVIYFIACACLTSAHATLPFLKHPCDSYHTSWFHSVVCLQCRGLCWQLRSYKHTPHSAPHHFSSCPSGCLTDAINATHPFFIASVCH